MGVNARLSIKSRCSLKGQHGFIAVKWLFKILVIGTWHRMSCLIIMHPYPGSRDLSL